MILAGGLVFQNFGLFEYSKATFFFIYLRHEYEGPGSPNMYKNLNNRGSAKGGRAKRKSQQKKAWEPSSIPRPDVGISKKQKQRNSAANQQQQHQHHGTNHHDNDGDDDSNNPYSPHKSIIHKQNSHRPLRKPGGHANSRKLTDPHDRSRTPLVYTKNKAHLQSGI